MHSNTGKVPDKFILIEPSIIYQEVCGTFARKVEKTTADKAKEQLDLMIHPLLLTICDKTFCTSAYRLCAEYNTYAIDALYLKVALDKEDFYREVKSKKATHRSLPRNRFPILNDVAELRNIVTQYIKILISNRCSFR
jgi:hypothetical protein